VWADDVDLGREIYNDFCVSCHGRHMVAPGGVTFDLRKFPKDDFKRFRKAVLEGKPPAMPAWRDKVSDDDLNVLWAYVRGGGRPVGFVWPNGVIWLAAARFREPAGLFSKSPPVVPNMLADQFSCLTARDGRLGSFCQTTLISCVFFSTQSPIVIPFRISSMEVVFRAAPRIKLATKRRAARLPRASARCA
jgi:Cytochrome C oxidase, cbb3-type, subunit III